MTPSAAREERKLTREEMEALLAASHPRGEAPGEKPEPHARRVHRYDFTQPSRFNRAQQEQMRKTSDAFAQKASETLTRLLRNNVRIQFAGMDHLKWENLLSEAGEAVVAYHVLLKPLGRRGLATVQRPLAACCLERLTGGPSPSAGNGGAAGPEAFTALDVRIFSRFLRAFFEPLPQAWERLGPFQVEIGAHVPDLQGLDTFANGEDMFQLHFLMQGAGGAGQVSLAVPFESVRHVPVTEDDAGKTTTADPAETTRWLRQSLNRTRVEVSAVLGSADVRVERLVQARPGDVIVLDRHIRQPVALRINDRIKFRGYPGVSNGRLAVRLIVQPTGRAPAAPQE